MTSLFVSSHPLLARKIKIFRDASVNNATDRRGLLKDISRILTCEATKNLKTDTTITIKSNAKEATLNFKTVSDQITLFPMHKDEASMTETMLELLPETAIVHDGKLMSELFFHCEFIINVHRTSFFQSA
jgi:uracil phosphoribosyltransferase